ncbi:lysylphosphatidylglycerol synthetase [Methanocalculus chunghsingensis]|uniref:Lysylphosphatidylglycerol synthetase n=1 Tax=Methanocalculus chunghsingensis TaxID=156457 RepID=A0A8J7W4G8_9EURY|nr:flippase-like domain-containing protein [Methanocalculus chunghsingensis]MBR1368026.1 lysylphosphatidylglycerol synthetase [Methanocalculus chunghsingensis]
MNQQHKKWIWISVGLSTVFLLGLLYFTYDESTFIALQNLSLTILLLALFCHLLALLCWSLRVKMMSYSLGYHVGFLHCFNLVCANLLVAAITPSQAGGEPVRIHELYRADVKLGDATAIVIMERVLDGIVLGLGGVISLFLLGSVWQSIDLPPALTTLIYLSWFLVTICLVIFVISVRNPFFLKRLIRGISRLLTKKWDLARVERFLEKVDREVDNFHYSLGKFIGRGKFGLFIGLIMTCFFWFFQFIIASILLIGLGVGPHYLESFVSQLIIAVIMMIPLTPGGAGVAEVSISTVYGLFISTSVLGVFVLLWRLILYYLNIILGLVASLIIVRREVGSIEDDQQLHNT